jgi:competence protein ComGC
MIPSMSGKSGSSVTGYPVTQSVSSVRSSSRSRSGFTLAETMITLLILMILLMVATPNFTGIRDMSDQRTCIGQLNQIDAAKRQYMLDQKLNDGDPVLMSSIAGPGRYIPGPVTGPVCPGGGTYTVGALGTTPSCTISGHTIAE